MLEKNRRRIQNLSGTEIWLFIVGRVLVAFGLGITAMIYLPHFFAVIALPSVVTGIVLLLIASRGLKKT